MLSKQQILTALQVWIRQRPGLEFGNYGNLSSYRAELRQIAKDKRDAETLLSAVALRDSITAEDLLKGFRAYSGRLSISESFKVNGAGNFNTLEAAQQAAKKFLPNVVAIEPRAKLDYCTGQYWPTEYRKAACAVLASALWERKREDIPKPFTPPLCRGEWYAERGADGKISPVSAGDWIRNSFRREFGRSIAQRWFS